MGLEIEQFVEAPHPRYVCVICHDVMDEPVMGCDPGHNFCEECVQDIKNCPLCRARFRKFMKNSALKDSILELKVYCAHSKQLCQAPEPPCKKPRTISLCDADGGPIPVLSATSVAAFAAAVAGVAAPGRAVAASAEPSSAEAAAGEGEHSEHTEPEVEVAEQAVANLASQQQPQTQAQEQTWKLQQQSAQQQGVSAAILPTAEQAEKQKSAACESSAEVGTEEERCTHACEPQYPLFCDWIGPLETLQRHLGTVCLLHPTACRFAVKGCGVVLERCRLPVHEASCDFRFLPCPHCAQDFFAKDLPDHLDVCVCRPVTCELCQQHQCQFKDLQTHQGTVCPDQEVDCQLAHIGCKERVKRGVLSKHMTDSTTQHLQLCVATVCELKAKEATTANELREFKQTTNAELGSVRQQQASLEKQLSLVEERLTLAEVNLIAGRELTNGIASHIGQLQDLFQKQQQETLSACGNLQVQIAELKQQAAGSSTKLDELSWKLANSSSSSSSSASSSSANRLASRVALLEDKFCLCSIKWCLTRDEIIANLANPTSMDQPKAMTSEWLTDSRGTKWRLMLSNRLTPAGLHMVCLYIAPDRSLPDLMGVKLLCKAVQYEPAQFWFVFDKTAAGFPDCMVFGILCVPDSVEIEGRVCLAPDAKPAPALITVQ